MHGVAFWNNSKIVDARGSFVKTFTTDHFQEQFFPLHEVFISNSTRGVVRGLHLQLGSSKNYRLIQVIRGSIHDVLLDLRADSDTYGTLQFRKISFENFQSLLVPPGVAHGFQALEDCQMLYMTTSRWNPSEDSGVHPLESGIEWPLPITKVSERDLKLPTLKEFLSETQRSRSES